MRCSDSEAGLVDVQFCNAPDTELENELETFRHEAEGCTQFFYSYLALHAVAGDDQSVYRTLNQAPLFWNTALAALQAATFIGLGRIFDQGSPHNIDRVPGIAQRNPEIFARAALGARRQGRTGTPPEYLEEYIKAVFEDPGVIVRILSHLSLPARAPPRAPARLLELVAAA